MNDPVVICGGGFSGLAASLFLARRGHIVTLIERDGPPPGPTADDDAEHWSRPGAPQSAQTHLMLGRARRILVDEVPDVIEALLARGAREAPVVGGMGSLDGESFLMSRRPVAEGELRRAVEREPGITVVLGAVAGLITGLITGSNGSTSTPGASVPHVTGVRLATGETLPASVVVDAGGRRSALPSWLADVGARPCHDQVQECGFFYATRYYRLRAGNTMPVTRVPSAMPLDYATVLAVGADNDTFSVTVTLSTQDPLRARIRNPEVHTAFTARVPSSAPWVAAGDPITDVSTMSRIENRRRTLVDGDGPIVTGLVAIGDAALHTNPTLGRGISLSCWHAQHLADVIGEAADDPAGFVERFHDWTQDNLAVWFDSQVSADAASVQRLEAGLRGERLPAPDDPMSRFIGAAFACAQRDAVVGRAVASVVHLFAPPAEAFAPPDVGDRVRDHMAAGPPPDRPADVPTRAEFEAMVSG